MKASEVKRGNVVEHENTVYQVRDIERSSPSARGGNVTYRFTLYSIPGGRKYDLSLRADDEIREIELSRRQVTFSYKDGDAFVFMDAEDFTQYLLAPEVVGDNAGYVVEGVDNYYVQVIDDAPVGLQVPTSVVLTVVETAPEMKGSSATKRNKPATLETGVEIQVPEYISTGEKVTVNTLTHEFAGRA
jgi:elongation factor P